jgi:uncharacterized membrane-anchored protein YjiN (DUF445 family)
VLARNKARIADAIGAFVVANFLTAEELGRKLREIDISDGLSGWLARPGNIASLARRVAPLIPRLMQAAPSEAVRSVVGDVARQGLEAVRAAPVAAQGLAAVWDQGHGEALMNTALRMGHDYISRNKAELQTAPADGAGRRTGNFIDRFLTGRAIDSLLSLLDEMRRPDHPWRAEVHAYVRGLIVSLATDPDMIARGEALKAELLAHPALRKQVRSIWDELERQLRRDDPARLEAIAHGLEHFLHGLADWLRAHERERALLDRWAQRALRRAVLPRRAMIGDFIAQVVSRWDTATMTHKLELEFGPDLQFIRINGAVVGGIAGLVIYGLSRAAGLV